MVRRLLLATEDSFSSGTRPSVESHLHALLGRYVIHLHPYVVGAYVNAKEGCSRIDRLFKSDVDSVLWVPYADSGLRLAQLLHGLISVYAHRKGRMPGIMLLEKHGLLISADSTDAALSWCAK